MKYIDKHLAKEIRNKHNSLSRSESHDNSIKRDKLKRRKIEKSAQYNSFRIEHPNTGGTFSVPRNSRFVEEGTEHIANAYLYGKENFDPETVNEEFVRTLGGFIMPYLSKGTELPYRDTGTRITGASVIPPDPYKVKYYEMPWFINSLKENLGNEDLINKVEAAIFAHLHLVRIHPFVDGNGRTSRALQDIILDHYGFPLPIIASGERNTYYQILDKAVYDWKHEKKSGDIQNGATEGENMFYTFMAGKINSSLDRVINGCRLS